MSASIFEHFVSVTDPRVNRGHNHSLYEMIVVALAATICGANGWTDVERFGYARLDWFKKFLELEHGIPSHDTFGRVFAALDTEEFLSCLQNWIGSLRHDMTGEPVAIDGKVLRHSFDNATGLRSLHIVNAWATGMRICLGQVTVPAGESEVHVVPQLLQYLELQGAVVTLDALHCTKETAEAIRERGADYILAVKKNQPTLFATINELFSEEGTNTRIRKHITASKSHGREERREYQVAAAPPSVRSKWKNAKSVGVVHRYRKEITTGTVHRETKFFVSSLPARVRKFSEYVRGHWRVENSLHWCLDVTFGEDASRIRKGRGQEIAAIFRRLALSILQKDTTQKDNIRGKRLIAGWNTKALEQILTQNKGR